MKLKNLLIKFITNRYIVNKYTTPITFDSLYAISNTLSLRLDFLKQMPMVGIAAGDKIIENCKLQVWLHFELESFFCLKSKLK
jgi:hypothetical protein